MFDEQREPTVEVAAWGYRPALDGLRAVAVYLVVVFHADVVWLPGGFIGVDVFFVLSGFLVTNVLVEEWSVHDRIDLRRFYARRVRRLLPLAVVTIAVTTVLSTWVLSQSARRELVGDAQASLLYVANWNFLGDATDYFAADTSQSPFLHFWSLAIEEQFYVVFPAVLIVSLRLRRRWPWFVGVMILGLFAASVTAQVVVARSDSIRAYYGSETRVYQMLAGVLLALVLRSRSVGCRGGAVARASGVGSSVALVGLVAVSTSLVAWTASWRGLVAAGLSVLLIAGVDTRPHGLSARLLSSAPLVRLGKISYGTYLWHWPVIVLARPVLDLGPYRTALVAGTAATVLAGMSSVLLESRVRGSRRLDGFPNAVVGVGLAASAVLAVLVVPTVLSSDRRPIEAARERPTVPVTGTASDVATQDVPADLDLAATQPIDVDLAGCRPTTPEGCVLVQGSGARIHLIGDSNVDMMIHAMLELAAENDWTLSVNTALGCPWQRGLSWVAGDDRLTQRCRAERDDWYDVYIPALRPDLVIAFGVPRDAVARGDGSVYVAETPGTDIDEAVALATATSIEALKTAMTGSVLVLEPLPYSLDFDPTECLTTADVVGDCAYTAPVGPLPVEVASRMLARNDSRVDSADIDKMACPYLPVCLPLVGGEVVFRNQLHLSDAWMVDRREELADAIRRAGVVDVAR